MKTRFNPTVVLTLGLLFFMVIAGGVSASWGYALGRKALRGITQPDVRPDSSVNTPQNPNGNASHHNGFTLLREDDILKDVEARIKGGGSSAGDNATSSAQPKALPVASTEASPETTTVVAGNTTISVTNSATPQAGFPITSTDKDVTFQIRSAYVHDGELVMEVSLQNGGANVVQFLYSFMDVRDDQGRTFSATTQGLPAELPPNSEKFSGVVNIPSGLLEGSSKLTLSLADYPDQQVHLQLPDIPVNR